MASAFTAASSTTSTSSSSTRRTIPALRSPTEPTPANPPHGHDQESGSGVDYARHPQCGFDSRPTASIRTYISRPWNLTLSKQFWSNVLDVSYVGVKGTHQDTSIPYFNTGPPQPANLTANGNRPYPTFGNIRLVDYHGASMYNGLKVHFEHQAYAQVWTSRRLTLGLI